MNLTKLSIIATALASVVAATSFAAETSVTIESRQMESVMSEPEIPEGLYRAGTELIKSDSPSHQEKGVAWLTKAPEQGHAPAQIMLGIWYGDKSAGNDAAESLRWYRKAAEQGIGKAQWEVGRALHISNDEAKQREAIPWLDKAAAQGEPKAMMVLGRCYADGIGVEKNIKI